MKRLKPRINGVYSLIGVLFVVACALGILAQKGGDNAQRSPRAQYNDASPLGGKGLRLMLERLGYNVHLQNEPLAAMPKDARVWVLLDSEARFSQRESDLLVDWVRKGGTLLWACAPGSNAFSWSGSGKDGSAHSLLCKQLGVQSSNYFTPDSAPLPTLTPLTPASAIEYWNGVTKATASADTFQINRSYLELAGTPVGCELARISVGSGRVFVASDALMFTNYGLSKPDNAVLATNLIRLHAMNGGVYFDERSYSGAKNAAATTQGDPDLGDYLWQPPVRWAILQLLGALLLWWALAGRRLGAPVPLPEQESVTRASQFAQAMGGLFRKANRPQAIARTLGDSFRREVTSRVGLPLDANDDIIAERVAQATGFPTQMVDRLLLRAKAPDDRELHILSDTQEMEIVLRALRGEHS